MRNTSGHGIQMPVAGCYQPVQAQVLDGRGRILYPPAFPQQPVPSCPYRRPITVPSGATITRRPIVILRGTRLRSLVTIVNARGRKTDVLGGTLKLDLVPAQPTHVSLLLRSPQDGSHGGLRSTAYTYAAQLYPVPAHATRIYSVAAENCTYADGSGELTGAFPGRWQRRSGSVLQSAILGPRCARGESWRFVAGWLGHPAAELNLVIKTS